MREISWFDKVLMVLGFLLVAGIFSLAFVMHSKGGQCVYDPCGFLDKNKYGSDKTQCVINPTTGVHFEIPASADNYSFNETGVNFTTHTG